MTSAVDNNLQSLANARNNERIAYAELEKAQHFREGDNSWPEHA